MSVEFTWHAAKRVLQRGVDPAHVLRVAERAIEKRIGALKPERVNDGALSVIVHGNQIVTVIVRQERIERWLHGRTRGARRNRRNKAKRQDRHNQERGLA